MEGRNLYGQKPTKRQASNIRTCSGTAILNPRILKCSLMGISLPTETFKVPGINLSPVASSKTSGKLVIRCLKCPAAGGVTVPVTFRMLICESQSSDLSFGDREKRRLK